MPSLAPINASTRSNAEEGDEPLGGNRVGEWKEEHWMVGPVPGERNGHTEHRAGLPDDLRDHDGLRQRERRHRPTDSAQDIEEEERPAAHPLFDRRAEDEEDEHVEQDVRNAGVEEHVRDERPGALPRMRRRKRERIGKARGSQQRVLDQEHEQVGDEQSSHPWSQTVHALRAHLFSYVSFRASGFYPPYPALLFRARLAIRSHSSGKGMPAACAA